MDLKSVEKLSKLFEKAINTDKGHLIIISIPDDEYKEGTYQTMISSAHIPKNQIQFILHKFLFDLDNVGCKNKVFDENKEVKFGENQNG